MAVKRPHPTPLQQRDPLPCGEARVTCLADDGMGARAGRVRDRRLEGGLMPAPSTVFHRRRLSHGAGECLAIGPVAVPWAEAGSLGGVR